MKSGDIAGHQLNMGILGVSLRAVTRVAGESPRKGIGDVAGRLIDYGLSSRRCNDNARSRQNEHASEHDDTHDGDEREAGGPPF
jgi:hypothetical protein